MSTPTDKQLLDATIEAIHALTVGGLSAYSINGRSVTKQDLATLWDQREKLERRIARASRPIFGRASFRRID